MSNGGIIDIAMDYKASVDLEAKMQPFIDKDMQAKISNLLETLNEAPNTHEITIQDIDLLLKHVAQKASDSTRVRIEKANKELSIAYFGRLIIGLIALKIADPQNSRPINSDWLLPESTIDPNVILECLLVNITNQCFAIIGLSTLGYTWPARVLLRTTLELT